MLRHLWILQQKCDNFSLKPRLGFENFCGRLKRPRGSDLLPELFLQLSGRCQEQRDCRGPGASASESGVEVWRGASVHTRQQHQAGQVATDERLARWVLLRSGSFRELVSNFVFCHAFVWIYLSAKQMVIYKRVVHLAFSNLNPHGHSDCSLK